MPRAALPRATIPETNLIAEFDMTKRTEPLRCLLILLLTPALAFAQAAGAGSPPAKPKAGGGPAARQKAPGGCVRVHHLWKRQLAALDRTAGRPAEERTAALVAEVYRPYQEFWVGYVGDEAAFAKWARTRLDLEGDPRRAIPFTVNTEAMILDASRRVAAFAGRPAPCSDWYLVYGPGWTNMGGLTKIGMVVDFLGMPRDGGAEDFRVYLPHEVAHLVFGPAHAADPDAGTLLARIVEEGFASYFSRLYWGRGLTPARALGYTEAEWRWALAHERELWALAAPQLRSRDRAVLERFSAVRSRPLPGGPGKVGYFLGYRMAEAYVARHGRRSWRKLFSLPYARILEESGFAARDQNVNVVFNGSFSIP